ncbi:MAG: EAL domain-containing protein [Gammaproteobacteria bacterium]|nr:MAG: EAL domain-containing protein [Gammaproteobacteria bacterium]UCH39518.1 MAG: EAL domain-containing protein [Gammaproteobacteria bacterium]
MTISEDRFRLVFLLSGAVITALVCWSVFSLKSSQQSARYETQIDRTLQAIGQRLVIAQASLDALVGLYQASDEMDAALFTPFSEEILQDYRFIDSLQYQTYITRGEKQQLIDEMHEAGFSQFSIKRSGVENAGLMDSDYYLVTSFLEPLTPSSANQMGMDWLASGKVEQAFLRAASENMSQLISAPRLLEKSRHLILLKPTYFGRSVQSDAADRFEQVSGMFAIVLDWDLLTGFSHHEGKNPLAVDFSLITEGGELFAHQERKFTNENETSIEAGNILLTVKARYLSEPTQDTFWWVLLAGLLSVIVYTVTILELRSRYLLQRDKNRAQSQLYRERERAEVALRSIGDAVITTDIDQDIIYMNPVAEHMLGCRLQDVHGRHITELVRLEFQPMGEEIPDPIGFYIDMTQTNLRQTGIDIVLKVGTSRLSVDGNASPLLDSQGELIGSMLVLRDVSLEQELTNQLVYQASHDSLTGLMNRSEFENRVKESLELSRQQNRQNALFYIDLDQFKLVNDTCGHGAGDELLKRLAGVLQAQIRKEDVVARLGGDEFGILLHDCDQDHAKKMAERTREALHEMRFRWKDKIFDVSGSIGLVMINRMSGSLSELMSAADLACYAAKDAGRDVVHFYHADDAEIAAKFRQMQWLPRIREAIKSNEFELALQPVESLKDGSNPRIIYEFLLRWPQDDGSYISPSLFIPSAERYDLMSDLDLWVIENTLAVVPKLKAELKYPENQMFTINLSGQSVCDPTLADFIIGKLRRYEVNPKTICFEVTETVAIANFSTAIDFINSLRELGCRFALDDFGSGLSSFSYLKRLPLDFLKIDGLFVRDMVDDPVDLAMVRTIHDVAKVLKLQTIAEWVEDAATLDSLDSIGIDFVQGFHISKPIMVSELLPLAAATEKEGPPGTEGRAELPALSTAVSD